jgi:5,10-methylenetetrahydrofolate reductase
MHTTLPRILAHIFAPPRIPSKETARLQSRIAEICQAQGRALVGVIVGRGPPRIDPAAHISLQRMAFGDADELIVVQMPGVRRSRENPDALLSQLDRPVRIFSTAQLACRGLLLRGSLYTPRRTLGDAADLARVLRAEGQNFQQIANRLNADGFRTARRCLWYSEAVFKLLACSVGEVPRVAT